MGTTPWKRASYLMPRSQPAVRATALAFLALRRSYVSNSAFPAADWGLEVILQPPYRQRTSLAVAVPPTHRIARRKSHSEGTFNVRRCACLYLSGTAPVRWRHHSRASHARTYLFLISMISCSNMLTQAAHLHNNGHVNVIIMIGCSFWIMIYQNATKNVWHYFTAWVMACLIPTADK